MKYLDLREGEVQWSSKESREDGRKKIRCGEWKKKRVKRGSLVLSSSVTITDAASRERPAPKRR
jgi:hypothetical protein